MITGPAGLLGHGDQVGESRGIAERSGCGQLVDPRDPRPLERSELEPLDFAQNWSGDLWSPEVGGQCGRVEQAAAAALPVRSAPRPVAALSPRPDRTALPCSRGCLLQLGSHVLVLSGDQCRPVPDPTVGLVLERLASASCTRPRSVTVAFCRTAERISGWRKRTVCRSSSTIAASAAGTRRSRSSAVPATVLPARRISLALVAVVQRRDEQEQAGLVGQLGRPGRERPLEALVSGAPGPTRARRLRGARRRPEARSARAGCRPPRAGSGRAAPG